jgi:predicted RecA/RadA family phage recombinase
MQNYVHRGETLSVAAPYAVNSGGGVKAGSIFGVAVYNAVLGASLEIMVEGVFDLAKDTSTFNGGDKVYWDDTNKVATSTATGNSLIGIADLPQASGVAAPGGASGDATVRVRLNGVSLV